jgi:tRNA threonylcarbamoyladenosine modification (KEOPS) complex Cgi121 subunit
VIEAKILDKHLVVEGFKNVKAGNVDDVFNLIRAKAGSCQIQILDAKFVAGFEHIFFAVLNALNSFKSGLNLSRSLAIEVLLFASGQDQIKRAIEVLGVKLSTCDVALVIIADSRDEALLTLKAISEALNWEADQKVIDLTNEKISHIIDAFGVSDLELEASMRDTVGNALKNVLIERAALLIAQR